MQHKEMFTESIFAEILDEKAIGDNWVEIKAGIILAREKGHSVEDLSEFAKNAPAGDELWKLFLKRRSIISPLGFQYDFADLIEEVLDKDIVL